MTDREIDLMISPYASEATRLLMRGYVNRMLTAEEVHNTIRAALRMLAEHMLEPPNDPR